MLAPDHGFESIGDVLKRLGVKLTDATTPTDEAAPAPSCDRCGGAGWLSRDGLAVECPCGLVRGRRMARIWASSQVPESMRGYTLASYVERTGDELLVEDIRAAWDQTDRWLLFVGAVGLGKTGLAVSLLMEHIRSGKDGLYVVTPSFLSRIRATYTRVKDGEVDEMDVMSSVNETPLLVLDDIGKVALSEWGREKLFTLVNERAVHCRRTILTSNLDTDDGSLGAHLWPATWDRLRGMSEVFRLDGASLR